jgi:hypothetical protein
LEKRLRAQRYQSLSFWPHLQRSLAYKNHSLAPPLTGQSAAAPHAVPPGTL